MASTAIIWFRNDLRLQDNPALNAALEHDHLIPLYIHAPQEAAPFEPGAASNWWLYHSLSSLDQDLKTTLDTTLQLRAGDSLEQLQDLIRRYDVDAVYWNRRYEPALRKTDESIKLVLKDVVSVKSFHGSLIFEPWQIQNQQGLPYRVFTPFYKSCLQQLPIPLSSLTKSRPKPLKYDPADQLTVKELGLLSSYAWYKKFEGQWQIGEQAALSKLDQFLNDSISIYKSHRDFVSEDATSRLSPHLHFGEISPRQILSATSQLKLGHNARLDAIEAFERQLYWRDFGHHLLYHFPETTEKVFNEKYTDFPWQHDQEKLEKWQCGETGIPMIDAGMRELWETGTMHNRVRMITASFLTKNLGQHWLDGARWFWDTLLDADLANNTLGWQWVAGCGADAAPYYRIFNPISQGLKFDPDGDYIRRWLPELSDLPNKYIHAPWQASNDLLSANDGTLYPAPIVDLAASRQAALDAYQSWKNME